MCWANAAGEGTASIFISYRRSDSQGFAGRVADDLTERWGEAHVFRDVEIVPGEDFAAVIRDGVTSSSLLLVVIGRDWAGVEDAHGGRRLEDPEDWVRIEIEAALERGVPIVPVLVGQAPMPGAHELPASLRPLCRIQAHVMTDRSWDLDLARLGDVIEDRVPALRIAARRSCRGPAPAGPAGRIGTAGPSRRRWRLRPPVRALSSRALALLKRALVLGFLLALGYFVLENYAGAGTRQFVYGFIGFVRETVVGFFSRAVP